MSRCGCGPSTGVRSRRSPPASLLWTASRPFAPTRRPAQRRCDPIQLNPPLDTRFPSPSSLDDTVPVPSHAPYCPGCCLFPFSAQRETARTAPPRHADLACGTLRFVTHPRGLIFQMIYFWRTPSTYVVIPIFVTNLFLQSSYPHPTLIFPTLISTGLDLVQLTSTSSSCTLSKSCGCFQKV